ncbi:DNA-processing protein DprA [Patescibacteria group bacterium]|nr:DNA-processing protein DprA [Patescibacteria group bacterium]MBU0777176.1 DNA-processing protein DprA [Patescibacteria group bacterium]MBU0845871.1 DNA-processing protein DprA [Patescibacteria group bacterium]MBU0922898.1 DNA-processing protein DprA [Patescibacteria group bacterium]MBU1066369.1 DNA-processing protein DprA [Patescibacteria group bacterium]
MNKEIYTADWQDKRYPENLLALPDNERPELLYISGKIRKRDRKAVAIVGSRKMTDYGKRMAAKFARELAKNKVTIISGLARGIDTIAHKAALSAGGRTIAVLGCGLDIIYPPENKALAERVRKNGALVSEFPLGTKPLGRNFLTRNRIISGLSLAVLVVEGARRSGTLSTASWAANQGREVFAIPGPIDSPLSAAPLFLIENGAQIAQNPKDILDVII